MSVLRVEDGSHESLVGLLARYGLQVIQLTPPPGGSAASRIDIPGSYWGDSEAGLVGDRLYVRPDTPLHSALHEGCHFICMDPARRSGLERDAGGDYDEENAVCYLQIVLAAELPALGRERMWADMDAWGYTFRLGSARAWFEQDAEDARQWLQKRGIIDAQRRPTFQRVEESPASAA